MQNVNTIPESNFLIKNKKQIETTTHHQETLYENQGSIDAKHDVHLMIFYYI